ncbi:unnamed protein product, partial [marine sediment metagenome]
MGDDFFDADTKISDFALYSRALSRCRVEHFAEKLKHDKLVAEKQAILDFMREIDEKKKEVFMQTFNELSQYFSKIFSELSPGGVARLILENEEIPFEGGLEIEAKPAG